ncbi:MAG: histidine kinase [Verrucomicrobia bacterium]|nr:MAG: histidine kinase [Verrucomicrobiota bacterium]
MTDHAKHAKAESLERRKAAEPGPSAGHPSSDEMTVRRKLAESSLRDSEERLRAILETAVEGIITIDERGIIESLNPAAEKIFGYQAQEVVGKNVKVLMPTPYRDEHDGYLGNYLRTGRARIIGIGREVVGLRKDGTIFPMDLSVSEVRLAHKRLFTGFVRDISDRKRLEREVLQISDLEQRRIGQDLHDGLCQQLAGIELMSEVLEQNLSRKSKTEAAQAAKIAEGVRAAIGDTRMLARGLSPVDVESNGLMSALQELASNTEKLFHVACRFECPQPVLVRDHASATHLYRIAQEAINNAIKHGKAREITVRLTARSNQANLTVTDDGRGFVVKPEQTSGMGLRIMKYRAGMIGATLEIRRANGRGMLVACMFKSDL